MEQKLIENEISLFITDIKNGYLNHAIKTFYFYLNGKTDKIDLNKVMLLMFRIIKALNLENEFGIKYPLNYELNQYWYNFIDSRLDGYLSDPSSRPKFHYDMKSKIQRKEKFRL